MLANLILVKDFVDSLKRNGQRLHKMGSPVPNWILTAILLYNLGNLYESSVSFTLQNIQGTEPDLNQILSQLLDKEKH